MRVFRYIGIDPGINGGVGILDQNGCLLDAFDIPTIMNGKKKELHVGALKAKIVHAFHRDGRVVAKEQQAFNSLMPGKPLWIRPEECIIAIEKCSAMPKQGSVSTFRFGYACGVAEGLAVGLGTRIQVIAPKTWMSSQLKDIPGKDTHARAIIAASRRWPELELTRKKDHNIACALLIAEYSRISSRRDSGRPDDSEEDGEGPARD